MFKASYGFEFVGFEAIHPSIHHRRFLGKDEGFLAYLLGIDANGIILHIQIRWKGDRKVTQGYVVFFLR